MFIIRTYFRIMWLWFLLTVGGTAVVVTVLVLATDGFGSAGLVHLQERTEPNGDVIIVPDTLNNVVERRDVFAHVPLPDEISTEPPVIATNFGITIFLIILFGIIATMLNNLLREKEDRLEAWLSLFGLNHLWRVVSLGTGAGIQRGCLGAPLLILVFALYGLIFAFVEEGLDISQAVDMQLAVVLGMAGAIVSLSGDFAQRQVAFFWRKTARYGVYPANLLIAIATTLVSRVLNLNPGIMFGVPGGVDVEDMENEPPFRQIVLGVATMIVLLTIGAGAWGLVAALDAAGNDTLNGMTLKFTGPLFALLQTLGFALFVMAIQTAFFEMAPVGYTMGGQMFRWNILLWLGFFAASTFGFLHVLLNPRTEYLEAFEQAGVQALLGATVILAVITAGAWVFLTFVPVPFGNQRPPNTLPPPIKRQAPTAPRGYQPPVTYQPPVSPPSQSAETRPIQRPPTPNSWEATQVSQRPPQSLDDTQINEINRAYPPDDDDDSLGATRISPTLRPPE